MEQEGLQLNPLYYCRNTDIKKITNKLQCHHYLSLCRNSEYGLFPAYTYYNILLLGILLSSEPNVEVLANETWFWISPVKGHWNWPDLTLIFLDQNTIWKKHSIEGISKNNKESNSTTMNTILFEQTDGQWWQI